MHLLFATSIVPDGALASGYEIANGAIIEALRRAGVRVTVIINPRAGLFRRADQGRRHAELARAVLASVGVDADVQLTTHAATR